MCCGWTEARLIMMAPSFTSSPSILLPLSRCHRRLLASNLVLSSQRSSSCPPFWMTRWGLSGEMTGLNRPTPENTLLNLLLSAFFVQYLVHGCLAVRGSLVRDCLKKYCCIVKALKCRIAELHLSNSSFHKQWYIFPPTSSSFLSYAVLMNCVH